MSIRSIIFDMDGTLSATAQATEIAIRALTEKHSLPHVTQQDIRGAMGLGGLEFHGKLFPGMDEAKLAAIGADVDNLEEENVIKLGKKILFDGVHEMLERLAGEGFSLYIASTGSHRHVNSTLRAAEIIHFFTALHCDELQKRDMVRRIINNTDPAGWMMVGDMFKDAEAARANNILAVGAGFGYMKAENAGLFDVVLDCPANIFNITNLAKGNVTL